MGEGSARFSVTEVRGGPWIVTDQMRANRLVASSPHLDVADMVAAFMNGDTDRAATNLAAALATIDAPL